MSSPSAGTSWSPVKTFGPFDLSVPRRAGQRTGNRTVWGGNYIVVRKNGQVLVLTSQELAQFINEEADVESVAPGH
jgi:hypothetical protein